MGVVVIARNLDGWLVFDTFGNLAIVGVVKVGLEPVDLALVR